jgi:hypothetical protein
MLSCPTIGPKKKTIEATPSFDCVTSGSCIDISVEQATIKY